MFKQLKRKMLVLNLSILTVLLIAVFSTLYLTSYNQVQRTIDFDLGKIMNNYNDTFPQTNPEPPDGDTPFLPERSVSFVIVTDQDGIIINYWYSFETSDDILLDSLEEANRTNGTFQLDGSFWAYKVEVRNDIIVYGFLDITSEHSYLTNMIWSFIAVFAGAFILVYLISNYFSNRSIERIKDTFEKQKQFIANASHEIKTPLAIIATNTDILLESDSSNKWLNYIKYETERMSKLTKDLLYLTKMNEQLPEEIFLSRTNLSELVESSILSFEALAYDKKINVNYEIQPEIFVDLDHNQFNQVFHILMDNAIKYTDQEGSINITLALIHNHILEPSISILNLFTIKSSTQSEIVVKVLRRKIWRISLIDFIWEINLGL